MMRGRAAVARPRAVPGTPPGPRPVARMASQVATSVASTPPLLAFALAFYVSVTVGRLHEVVGFLARLYVGKLSALLLLAAFVMESKQIPFAEVRKSKTAKCIAAVTLLGVLSIPTSYWPGMSAGYLQNTWPLIALVGVGVLCGMSNRVVARRTLAALTIVGAMGAAELIAGGGNIQVGVLSNGVDAAKLQRSYIAGGGSTTYDANYSAAFFVMMIPYALMFATQKKGMLRWIGIVAVPVLGMGMIKTGSRGGVIAAMVLAICIVIFADKKARPKTIVILAIGFAAMMASPHSELTQRIRTLFTGEDYNFDSKGGRWQIWANGLTMLLQRPVLGVGIGAFPVADQSLGSGYMDAHNSYVQIAAELGFPGITAFIIMILAAFKAVWAMRKSSLAAVRSGQGGEDAQFDLALSTAALCSLIAELTAAAFLSLAYEAMTMLALTVPVGIALLRKPAGAGVVTAARQSVARLRGMRPRPVPPQPTSNPRPAS